MSQKPKDVTVADLTVADLTIANSVVNLIQGDIQEHLPMRHIPFAGDVLGLRTTTSIDNGELIFLLNRDSTSSIWRCVAHDGSIVMLDDSYSSHLYVRIPWMDEGGSEDFAMTWELTPGAHQIEVIADPKKG